MDSGRTALIDSSTHLEIVEELTRRVQAEYAEMPGVCLTLPQAQRLWSADTQTCERVFAALTARGFLRKTTNERLVRGRH